MSSRFRNRKVSPVSRRAAAAIGICIMATPGLALGATPAPLVMGPLYAEPSRPSAAGALVNAGGCPIQIVELTDSRRGPQTVGSLLTMRSIQAPPDRQAWLQSAFETGLMARGFKPSFAPSEGSAPPAITARIRIRSIWISLLQMNKVGSLVFQASVARGGDPGAPAKIYRADKTSVNMWGSQSEFNGLVNDLFAAALDDLAEDLKPLCSSALSAPAKS